MQKDIVPIEKRKNVYKIACKSCDASYVGQTGRKLKIRLSEHRKHINRNINNVQSVITKHHMNINTSIRKMSILDEEVS